MTAMEFIAQATFGHAKQACYICGHADHLVDTDAVIQGEGTLAICNRCVKEMAHTAGFDVIEADPK